jgi:hypothetical protein
MNQKALPFSIGLIIGLLIVALSALICLKTYTFFSHGEGLGKIKSIGRKILNK